MTTIVFDGKTLATDSQITAGDVIVTSENKITKLNSGGFVAFTGNTFYDSSIAGYFNELLEKPIIEDETTHGLFFDGARLWHFDYKFRMFEVTGKYAIGTGREFAYAAMECGKNAIEAVEIACKFDVYSSLPVNSVVIK